MRVWPRSIRWQMLAGLMLLEVLSIVLFSGLLIEKQETDLQDRTRQRLEAQSTSLASQAREALAKGRPDWTELSARLMVTDPSVVSAKITDPAGDVLFVGSGKRETTQLNSIELAQIAYVGRQRFLVFALSRERLESVSPIFVDGVLRGYVWVENNRDWGYQQLDAILKGALVFGLIWLGASIVLVWLVSRAISRPLAVLHRGTRALMQSQEISPTFPLPVTVENEFGDLIEAFNLMVASIEEQRAGLNDTLSLLDSMLANAPIGLAFFDRGCRVVRVNQVFAEMNGMPLSHHLGRTLPQLVSEQVAHELEGVVRNVFSSEASVRGVELSGNQATAKRTWTWLVSAYPVKPNPDEVRWVGVIVMDTSERKRSEEALRRSEKLAATGRLAASISHEINNPLEAITNLLFLLRNYCPLEEQAMRYVTMAEHEARRISEITQQTLRFYRQPTQPARAHMGELLDSVLSLFHVRLGTLGIRVERDYDPTMDLFCFAGEIRQVIANLVGNAIDATSAGGRLIVRARRSRSWKDGGGHGVRITVADTGTGIEAQFRQRIFEPFFTTKEDTGTGLGLWVSREIILKHQGLVHVRSRDGATGGPTGTVFQLFFPDNQVLVAAATTPAATEVEA
ncbi:MAG TPA: ATP-binding protein [Terracidiphilus sp.]|nr:ATP-binding protein [Terracidiphilus sp.]